MGVNADTNMANELANIYNHKYDIKYLLLKLPDCFDDLDSSDANMEMIASSTIMPIRLPCDHNIVNHSEAIIFLNDYKVDKFNFGKKVLDIAPIAKKLLKDELAF